MRTQTRPNPYASVIIPAKQKLPYSAALSRSLCACQCRSPQAVTTQAAPQSELAARLPSNPMPCLCAQIGDISSAPRASTHLTKVTGAASKFALGSLSKMLDSKDLRGPRRVLRLFFCVAYHHRTSKRRSGVSTRGYGRFCDGEHGRRIDRGRKGGWLPRCRMVRALNGLRLIATQWQAISGDWDGPDFSYRSPCLLFLCF